MFKFKKAMSLLIIFTILLGSVSVFADGVNPWYRDGFHFEQDAQGRMTISRFSGHGGNIIIPSQTPTGVPVVIIGDRVFENTNLGSVTFQSGSQIHTIGNSAFRFSNLSSIALPNTVVTIGDEAFRGASRLTQIVLPPNLDAIGRRAFEETRLTEVTIPDRVRTIGDEAFRDISTLREAHFTHLDGRDISLGSGVFNRVHNSFIITHRPQASHFGRNWYPPHQTFPTDAVEVGEADWRWTSLPGNAAMIIGYERNSQLATAEEIEIPRQIAGRTVRGIQNRAFDSHRYLRSVIVPDTVEVIERHAFVDNRNLISVRLRHTNAARINVSRDAFAGNHHNFRIYFPYGASGFTTPTWQGFPAMPDAADGLWETTPLGGGFGFEMMITRYNGTASVVTIPSVIDGRPVTYIGSETFRDNTHITEIIVPESIVHIQANAVFNAPNLRVVRLRHMHADTLDLSGLAFSGVHSDFRIIFPGNAVGFTTPTWVGFPAEPDLISAHWEYEVSGNVATIIEYRGEDEHVIVPDYLSGSPVRIIATGAFRNNNYIERVTIPANVNTIESNAFHSCPNLYAAKLLHTNANQLNNFATDSFVGVAPHFRLIFPNNATGFTTPTWNGYFAVPESDDFTSIEGDFEFIILREPVPNMGDVTRDVIVITRYFGTDAEVSIPSSLRNIPVVGLGDFAFVQNLTMRRVTIPSSVVNIGHSTFLGSRYLEVAHFQHENAAGIVLNANTFRYTANNFTIIYPVGAAGFTTPTWQGWPARPDTAQPPTGEQQPPTPPTTEPPQGGLRNPHIHTTRTLNASDPHITRDGRVLTAPIFRLEPFTPNPQFSTSYVMVSVIADILGLNAHWNPQTRTATFSGYNANNQHITMALVIGSTTMTVNGVPRDVRASAGVVPAIVRDDRTFVPVLVFQEVFGVTVQWNGANRTVTVNP